jgi:DNA repair protein RecO (recombination protein O)
MVDDVSRREKTYRTEGVILRRSDFGEADRLLTMMTPHRGKIRGLAKGVRKPKSRKAGHVELLMRTDFFLAVGRSLDIITQAQVIEPYRPLREDIRRITYGYYFSELVDRFMGENEENQAVYQLLCRGLGWLCTTRDFMRTARYFELHLLESVGYRPQLQQCVRCDGGIESPPLFFSPAYGGVVCRRCGEGAAEVHATSEGVIRTLHLFQRESYQTCLMQSIPRQVRESMEEIMHRYVTYLLERQLKSIDYLKVLRSEMLAGLSLDPDP